MELPPEVVVEPPVDVVHVPPELVVVPPVEVPPEVVLVSLVLVLVEVYDPLLLPNFHFQPPEPRRSCSSVRKRSYLSQVAASTGDSGSFS